MQGQWPCISDMHDCNQAVNRGDQDRKLGNIAHTHMSVGMVMLVLLGNQQR